jgi:hypothetical protein
LKSDILPDYMSQLRPYHDQYAKHTVPEQGAMANDIASPPQVPAVTMRHRALDILGLNRSQMPTTQRSLEIEVETYLNDNSAVTDPLMFWQVGVAVVRVPADVLTLLRC